MKNTEFKGTKGEWKVSVYETEYGTKSIEIHYGNDGECVAEHVANMHDAQLIASAPEMLEALQNLENDNGQIPNHAWEMVQNAIKKAIG